MKIFLDVGHGGYDTGALFGNFIERDMNLVVALETEAFLLDYDVDVMLSRRTNDKHLSLEQRVKMANDWNADVYIGIHHNSSGGDGYEIIHTVFTEDSLGDELAEKIALEFDKLGQNRRRVFSKWNSKYNDNYYYTIRNANMDSIITEFAFIDSKDSEAVDTMKELQFEGEAIARGIKDMYDLKKDNPTWEEILEGCLDDPVKMINAVDAIIEIANLGTNLGDLEQLKYIHFVFEKAFKYGRNYDK